jgi:hypothetical protein
VESRIPPEELARDKETGKPTSLYMLLSCTSLDLQFLSKFRRYCVGPVSIEELPHWIIGPTEIAETTHGRINNASSSNVWFAGQMNVTGTAPRGIWGVCQAQLAWEEIEV